MNDPRTLTPLSARPPGPSGSVLLGNVVEFGRNVNAFLARCEREYGPIVRFRMAHRTAFLLADPEFNELMLLKNYRNFIKHQMFFRRTRAVFGKGLLSTDGDYWRRERKLCAPAFSTERINAYGEIMSRYAREMVSQWQDGDSRDIYPDMRAVTAKVVAQALFECNIASDIDDVGEAMIELADGITERMFNPLVPPDWTPAPSARRYRRSVARIDALLGRFIEEHRQSNLDERRSLLAMLMQARDEDGQPMSDQQLRDEAATLFLAGHDTTATAMAWTLLLLTQHPTWQAAVQDEVDRVLCGRAPGTADVPTLEKTGWVVREAMRLYPPVPLIARQSVEDCDIGGYRIPGGSLLYICPWVMHRNPRFFDEPDAFMPERWADNLEGRLPRNVYLPFSGGPRICIGARFSMMEATLLLANFMQAFSFRFAGNQPPEPFPSITLIPVGGVPLTLHARTDAPPLA